MSEIAMTSDVAKITLGGETLWERQDPDTTWYTCKKSLRSGMALLKFNEADSTGKIMIVGVPYYLPPRQSLTNVTLLQLPEGFVFGPNNPTTLNITDKVHIGSKAPIYDGDSLIISVTNNDSNYQEEVRLVPEKTVTGNVDIVSFNVERK
ncbi:hypothetical protein D8911_11410 [Levilactobacillus brevis]|nr:hypothetical protein D8911_11410 [Levilactobacillus brevis]